MVDTGQRTECIKTGGQGFLVEYNEFVYGDWFRTSNGTIICNVCYRGHEPARTGSNYRVINISAWFGTGPSGAGVLVVDPEHFTPYSP